MNLTNRVIVIIELLIVIALMPIFVVLLIFYRAGFAEAVTGAARDWLIGANAAYTQAICIGAAVLVFVVAILLLFLELRRAGRRVRVPVSEGHFEMTTDAISERLAQAILQIADVTEIKPEIIARKDKTVNVILNLKTDPQVVVPKKTQEAIAVAKQVLEERLGLQVGTIEVRVDHARALKNHE
ncbi:MAG: hypothetical protein HZC40_09495 [Chloroflexi bacterium]|nr:hypothetical protein [Chloroflexota bacterium]